MEYYDTGKENTFGMTNPDVLGCQVEKARV